MCAVTKLIYLFPKRSLSKRPDMIQNDKFGNAVAIINEDW